MDLQSTPPHSHSSLLQGPLRRTGESCSGHHGVRLPAPYLRSRWVENREMEGLSFEGAPGDVFCPLGQDLWSRGSHRCVWRFPEALPGQVMSEQRASEPTQRLGSEPFTPATTHLQSAGVRGWGPLGLCQGQLLVLARTQVAGDSCYSEVQVQEGSARRAAKSDWNLPMSPVSLEKQTLGCRGLPPLRPPPCGLQAPGSLGTGLCPLALLTPGPIPELLDTACSRQVRTQVSTDMARAVPHRGSQCALPRTMCLLVPCLRAVAQRWRGTALLVALGVCLQPRGPGLL